MSEKNFLQGKIGDAVKVLIPDMDRARGDSRNIIVIILDVIDDNYKLGTKEGWLTQLYARNSFVIYEEKFLSVADVPNIKISLRTSICKVHFNFWWSRLHTIYLWSTMQY